jgi:putative addiction module antidote
MSALKPIRIGRSIGVILPKEMIARLKIENGGTLFVSEHPDGVTLSPYDPRVEKQVVAGREFMAQYRDTFGALAKSPHGIENKLSISVEQFNQAADSAHPIRSFPTQWRLHEIHRETFRHTALRVPTTQSRAL